ncbi:MAG: PAS domain-containing protein [Betaproteobacteria bacterium]|nr:PAS domain-containing protein [Betaproteobacteria bacterium]
MTTHDANMRRTQAIPAEDPDHDDADAAGPCIVAVSAAPTQTGELNALFREIPADSGLAFVIVPGPDESPRAYDSLAGPGLTPPVPARSGTRIEAGQTYLLPPGGSFTLRGGLVRPARRARPSGPDASFSEFCAALAADQGERAVCVTLRPDHELTQGARAAIAAGGIVLVPRPSPGRGRDRGWSIGEVAVPLAEIPRVLVRYARHPYVLRARAQAEETPRERDDLDRVLVLIRDRVGLGLEGYRRALLGRRIARRMSLLGLAGASAYRERLERDAAEVDALVRDMLIGVTGFFRDPEAWRKLGADVIEPLVARRGDGDPIRIWVAACATGEEVYTVVMLLLDALDRAGKSCPLRVFATDYDADALEVARAGEYPAESVARIDPGLRQRYLHALPDGAWFRVDPRLREAVTFGTHLVGRDFPYARMDLVTCRNVLIYYGADAQRSMVSDLRYALRPGGTLMLGASESLPRDDRSFRALSRKWRLYRLDGDPDGIRGERALGAGRERLRNRRPVWTPSPGAVGDVVRRVLSERFAPAAVLVNAQNEVLYYSGATEPFFVQPQGTPTRNLFRMLVDALHAPVAEGLRRARDEGDAVRIATQPDDTADAEVGISVQPVAVPGEVGPAFLVVFESRPQEPGAAGDARTTVVPGRGSAGPGDMLSTIERLRTANAEIVASHDEIDAVNQELQSLNEELESVREELVSVNGELVRANGRLREELARSGARNDVLQRVIETAGVAAVELDADLNIRSWSCKAGASAVLPVRDADIGRPVQDLLGGPGAAGLVEGARAVLADHVARHRDVVSDDGRCFLRRIAPCDGESGTGVMVTFADITPSRRAADAALEAKQSQADLLEARVMDRTRQLRVLAAALAQTEERERRELALNLHDDLVQLLSLAAIRLSGLRDDATGTLREGIEQVAEVIGQANRSARSLASQLSPTVLYEVGLTAAVHWLADEMRRQYGLHVEVHDDGAEPLLSHVAAATVFRAVRELLINVSKHAGVQGADVDVTTRDGLLSISVRDGGRGFDPDGARGEHSLGLASVRERIALVDGTFRVESSNGNGTHARIVVPARARQEASR